MIIKISGCERYGKANFNIPKVMRKYFPKYFIVEIDTSKIKPREKGGKANDTSNM